METRANYVLVGAFTIAALVAGFLFIWWSANVSNQDSRVELLVRIEGSVNGLSNGSQVLFNGLRVGEVRNLRIDPNDPRTVIATTRVDNTTPITTSTRATIGFAGLTGQAFIELKGGSVNERNIIEFAQAQGAVPVIKADPSDVTDILATAKDIADRANNILGQFEAVVNDLGPAVRTTADNITATSGNIRQVTETLAQNSDKIGNFLDSAGRLADSVNVVAQELPDTVQSVRNLVSAVDPEDVRNVVGNVAAFTQTLRGQSDAVGDVIQSAKQAVSGLGAVGEALTRNQDSINALASNLGPLSKAAVNAANSVDTVAERASNVLAAVDAQSVNTTLGNVAAFSQTLRDQSGAVAEAIQSAKQAVGGFATVGDALAQNRDSINKVLANAGPISDTTASAAASINQAADRAASVLAAVDPQQVNRTVNSVAGITTALNDKSEAIQTVIDGTASVLRTADLALGNINATRQQVDRILSGINPAAVSAAVTNVSQATDNVARAADSIARVANDVGARRDDINRIITNVQEATAKVNDASGRIQNVLGNVDRFLGEDTTNGLVKTATDAFNAFETASNSVTAAANNLGNQVGPISASIQDFSKRGLGDVRGFVRSATDTVNRVGSAVDSLSSNPRKLLFGGDDIKSFDGRTRR